MKNQRFFSNLKIQGENDNEKNYQDDFNLDQAQHYKMLFAISMIEYQQKYVNH